jgi:hypothetical protein
MNDLSRKVAESHIRSALTRAEWAWKELLTSVDDRSLLNATLSDLNEAIGLLTKTLDRLTVFPDSLLGAWSVDSESSQPPPILRDVQSLPCGCGICPTHLAVIHSALSDSNQIAVK